jgi:RNA polymerase sigma-32 factor
MQDMIAEGTLGLMKAVKKFEPSKGFRLSTYAVWWIKASINEFVLNSWSLVKMGTVADQKKLFFRLGQLKSKLGVYGHHDLSPEVSKQIAQTLDVSETEVISMNNRMSGDTSLNVVIDEEGKTEKIEMLADTSPNQEIIYEQNEEKSKDRDLLRYGLSVLNEREQEIIKARKLQYNPTTLEELALKYGISRERVRQIEERAFEKMQKAILEAKAAQENSQVIEYKPK